MVKKKRQKNKVQGKSFIFNQHVLLQTADAYGATVQLLLAMKQEAPELMLSLQK